MVILSNTAMVIVDDKNRIHSLEMTFSFKSLHLGLRIPENRSAVGPKGSLICRGSGRSRK